jgi:hypothetical protein
VNTVDQNAGVSVLHQVEPYVRGDGATIVDVRVRVEQPAPPPPLSTCRR